MKGEELAMAQALMKAKRLERMKKMVGGRKMSDGGRVAPDEQDADLDALRPHHPLNTAGGPGTGLDEESQEGAGMAHGGMVCMSCGGKMAAPRY
jgi:hypothetical protein